MPLNLRHAVPFPWKLQLHLFPIGLQTATHSSCLRTGMISPLEPFLSWWPSPGISLNLALTSFKGIIGWHCNWLFTCLSHLGLWALGWQPLIWEPCSLSSTWLEWGFDDWFLNVCFTNWGHRGRSEEENYPPSSSTTQLWDFYKWFLLPCGSILIYKVNR